VKKRFNITFVGCKSKSTRSRKEGMEGKEGMRVKEREGGRGWKISY
jgi:hypothetical protein